MHVACILAAERNVHLACMHVRKYLVALPASSTVNYHDSVYVLNVLVHSRANVNGVGEV